MRISTKYLLAIVDAIEKGLWNRDVLTLEEFEAVNRAVLLRLKKEQCPTTTKAKR